MGVGVGRRNVLENEVAKVSGKVVGVVDEGFLFGFLDESGGEVSGFFGGEVFILLVDGGVFFDETLLEVG